MKTASPIVVEIDRKTSAEVFPGSHVRITGSRTLNRRAGRSEAGLFDWREHPDATEWLRRLSVADSHLLASMTVEARQGSMPWTVVADWLEDQGAPETLGEWHPRLYSRGVYENVEELLDKTYRVGDMAEYASYNLSYFGPILAVTPKTVTVADRHVGDEKHRMGLAKFVRYNRYWDFETARRGNSLWRD